MTFREATRHDIPAILALLRDDDLGRERESHDLSVYEAAFERIEGDPNNAVIVGVIAGEVVATYQITLIWNLSLGASRRAQVEAVRVAQGHRGQGIGARLMRDAEARAAAGGATLVQLTSNKSRSRAIAFYERQGYLASHIGLKKALD